MERIKHGVEIKSVATQVTNILAELMARTVDIDPMAATHIRGLSDHVQAFLTLVADHQVSESSYLRGEPTKTMRHLQMTLAHKAHTTFTDLHRNPDIRQWLPVVTTFNHDVYSTIKHLMVDAEDQGIKHSRVRQLATVPKRVDKGGQWAPAHP